MGVEVEQRINAALKPAGAAGAAKAKTTRRKRRQFAIADRYFTVSGDYNFGDIDILAAGPIAGQVSVAFDEFWNDRLAVPIEAFVSREEAAGRALGTRRKLEAFRAAALSSPYASYLRGAKSAKTLEIGKLPLIWAQGEVLYDRPSKVLTSIDKNPSAYMVFKLKENGIVVRSQQLARQLAAVFARRTSSGYAYRVNFVGALRGTNDTRLVWIDEIDGKAVHYSDEPMTGPGRRLKARFLSRLAPEARL